MNGSPVDLAAHMPLVQVLVPRVMALRPRFAATVRVSEISWKRLVQPVVN